MKSTDIESEPCLLQGFLNTTEFPKRARFERALFLFERLMADSGAIGFSFRAKGPGLGCYLAGLGASPG